MDQKWFCRKTTEWTRRVAGQRVCCCKKGDGFPWRAVVDLRGPNAQTKRCAYPLPKIEDLLIKQTKNALFSIIDLKKAFHQQPLHPDSRQYTSTNTPIGVYQWTVNVMGLTNAPAQFQRMMDDLLRLVEDTATPYIDDILVGSMEEEGVNLVDKHEQDLRRVLDVLAKEKLVSGAKNVTSS